MFVYRTFLWGKWFIFARDFLFQLSGVCFVYFTVPSDRGVIVYDYLIYSVL